MLSSAIRISLSIVTFVLNSSVKLSPWSRKFLFPESYLSTRKLWLAWLPIPISLPSSAFSFRSRILFRSSVTSILLISPSYCSSQFKYKVQSPSHVHALRTMLKLTPHCIHYYLRVQGRFIFHPWGLHTKTRNEFVVTRIPLKSWRVMKTLTLYT